MKTARTWQDKVIMIGGFILIPSILMSIISGVDMPLATTIPTTLMMILFMACYVTMRMYLAAFSMALLAICWAILIF